MNEYILVKDRLPEDDTTCLCAHKAYGIWMYDILTFYKSCKDDCGKVHKNKFWGYDSEYGDYFTDDITHWMPLPVV